MRTELNNMIAGIPMPDRIKRLPISPAGFPVPWFVTWYKDGKPCLTGEGAPDFRVANTNKMARAVNLRKHGHRLCWTCGEVLGRHLAFVIGPMCAINRTISEPPSHFECAEYSAKACPFLSKPRMRRNEKDLPEARHDAAGMGIKRNPGCVCVWVTQSYTVEKAHMGNAGALFHLGDPDRVLWFCEGREATRDEVLASIDSGYPLLQMVAGMEGNGAPEALQQYRERAMALLPAA